MKRRTTKDPSEMWAIENSLCTDEYRIICGVDEAGRGCLCGPVYAGAVILPGVTIGENSVIGAGSVVTKDVPKNSVAYGNPCRVVREINDRDHEYYYKNRKIDME